MNKIKFCKPNYDGKKANPLLLDEMWMWNIPKGKVFKIFKFFYLYYEKNFFWFRFFEGYGVWGSSQKVKSLELFSERIGKTKCLKLLGWKLKWLYPSKF